MNSNPVVWFEVYVADMARARKFYEKVFTLRLERLDSPDPEMWAFPGQENGAGACGALVRMEGCPPGGGGTLVYFSCDDCAEQAGRAAANGGHIVRDKFAIGQYGFISLVADTEGNVIGLHSMR
ncbi:VOC family protein [Zobellella aerophila]|uniref:VOC family protein n=1 Tax=Zobellella aerophila TaxID=870480 RepID=A0ABP6W4A3_9GAMM